MSSMISNIVETVYRVRGGNQLAQESRLVANGIGGIGRQIESTSRLSDKFNNQWRAIGTTLRYAIAGGVIFGLSRMVSQLNQVQQQLGLMQAIGQPAAGGIFTNNQITSLGNSLQRSAMDAITPINEVNDATVNLLSTVQNVPGSEIPSIITNIGRAAKLSQTPIEDLTKAAATMNIAFGRSNNAQTISQFTRAWFSLIKEAPGGVSAAPEIANQLGPLATMFALGQGPVSGKQSQAQMLADTLAVLRTGSTPSTGMRGLTYLLQSIIQPTGGARKALAGIGINPESIAREGVQANLLRLLNTITHTGNQRQIANMGEDALSSLDESGGSLPGIPPAEMTRLRAMIPRIHGIRAAVILAGQLRRRGQTLSLQQDVDLMQQSQDNTVDETHNFARAWKNFADRSKLQQATVALDTLRLQVAQVFEPVLNLAARGITGVANQAQHHRTATTIAVGGAAAMAAALGVRRFLGFGGKAGTALVAANAAEAAIRNNPSLGGSPQNPMYVVVVSQLFGSGGQITPKTGVEGKAEDVITKQTRRFAPWLAPAALRASLLNPGGMVLGGTILGTAGVAGYIATRDKNDPRAKGAANSRDIMDFLTTVQNSPYGSVNPRWMNVFQRYMQQQISPAQLQRMLGRADVYMTLDMKDSQGKKQTVRVHVPVNLYENGKVPSSRGKKAVKHG